MSLQYPALGPALPVKPGLPEPSKKRTRTSDEAAHHHESDYQPQEESMDTGARTPSGERSKFKKARLFCPNDDDEVPFTTPSEGLVQSSSIRLQDLYLPQDIRDKIPPAVGQYLKQMTTKRLKIAATLGLRVSELKYGDSDMSVVWDGISSKLVAASIEGRLNSLAARPDYTSPEPRIKDENENSRPDDTDHEPFDESHLTLREQSKLEDLLGLVPTKCLHWEAIKQMATAKYPVRREFAQRLISQISLIVNKLINCIVRAGQDDYEFPNSQIAHKALQDLPRCVLFLVGACFEDTLKSLSFGEPLSDSAYETIGEIAGEEIEDLLKFMVIFMGPSTTAEHAPLYWLSIRPKVKPLLEMPFIKDQQHLGDRLLEALEVPAWEV